MKDILKGLNDKQLEAAEHTEGPLLILAGAGSGKTRVLTHRIGYLIEKGVMPWQILAITFTNKAASEMRERVDRLLGGSGADVFVSTFHSLCVNILRRDIDKLGYARDFTIYDTDDQRTLMREVIKALNLDTKTYRDRAALSFVSSRKNENVSPEEYSSLAADYYERNMARIYTEYQKRLKSNNAVDFDDLLLLTVRLFKEFPEVLSGWQERFHYIMVDEYQDTNGVQFELVRMLSARYKNLCVVGDDDQSIYKFRGADIENILSFERSFPGTRVVKLEQNYRSTKNILNAANEVIKNNNGRKQKRLWTGNENGEMPTFREYPDARSEAQGVIDEAMDGAFPLKEQAVLYRTNAQSRLFEEACVKHNVPYKIVGGVNFYQRREIKDILSYLRLISNGVDDLALTRIVNVPKRGIGPGTVDSLRNLAASKGISMYDAIDELDNKTAAASKKLLSFRELIEGFRSKAGSGELSLTELITAVRDDTGYADELMKEGEIEGKTRLENIDELINKAADYQDSEGQLSALSRFLEEVSLIADIDGLSDSDDVLRLMTLHGAKGLEFDRVFLCGMEEGLFPSSASINADDPEAEIEEERRLCYVGITRARKVLRMSSAAERMVNGEMRYTRVSRFIDEIPDEFLIKIMRRRKAASWEDEDDDYDNPIPRRGFKKKNDFADSFGGFGPARGGSSFGCFGAAGGAGGSFGRSFGGGNPRTAELIGSGKVGSTGDRIIGAYGSLDKGGIKKRGSASGLAGLSKGAPAASGQKPDYGVGDRVAHIKFGQGTVLDIKEGSKDYEVTVDFDEGGVRRMFAAFARLKKL